MFHGDNAVFAGIQWFFWSGFGLIFAFLAAYYQDIGFSNIEIGLVMALVSAANIVGQPILGMVADRLGSAGRVLQIALIASVLLALALYLTPATLIVVAVLSTLVSFSAQTLPPIVDGWTMSVRRRIIRIDYGATRAMGSVGFSITVAVAGRLFDLWGLATMFPAAAGMFLLAILFVTIARRYDHHDGAELREVDRPSGGGRDFFSPRTVVFLIVGFVTFTAFRPVQVFLPVYIRQLGGTNAHIGYALAIMAISEVPFMVAYTRLNKRFDDTRILLFALVFFFVRIIVHAFAPGPTFVIAVQAIQGLSFGLYLPASVHILDRLSPEGTGTFAQTAGSVATFGLGSVVGSAVGGYLVEWGGLVTMYLTMSGLIGVAVILFWIVFVRTPLK
jgi:PPP family 3-phenylpropionic acid transporter